MSQIGMWRMKNNRGWISHSEGLTQDQVTYLANLKVGDKLVVFENDVREGEKAPNITLKRSQLQNENAQR